MATQWIKSYETELFDTPTGDLEIGQYAIIQNDWQIMRLGKAHIVNGYADHNFLMKKDHDVSKMIRVNSIGKAYYSEFLFDDATILRERITTEEYKALETATEQPVPKSK